MSTPQPSHRPDRFELKSAVFLVLRRNNEVLLLRRANTGYMDGLYSLVAGHLDGNEPATAAVVREAKEEAGITVKPEDLTFVHATHRLTRNEPNQERIDLFFECRAWEGDIVIAEPDKCDELRWAPLENLPDNVIPIVRLILMDIRDGQAYSEFTEEIQP